MEIVNTAQALQGQLSGQSAPAGGIAFVPTMGNLHEGHLSLVARGLDAGAKVVVSIFVNPLQFSAGEDLDAYPRTLEHDLAQLAAIGADLVFTPDVSTLYPNGLQAHTTVRVPHLTDVLCGQHRAGHFDGVTTVVCKLLNLVSPDIAFFGEKDLQQLLVIRRMVKDLAMPIRIEGVPTFRAADGLALSSRNSYLSPAERAIAPQLYKNLVTISEGIQSGSGDYAGLCQTAVQRLDSLGFVTEYCEVRRCQDLALAGPDDSDAAVFVAAQLGGTRLIDNIQVGTY